jgi:hypothetical protein
MPFMFDVQLTHPRYAFHVSQNMTGGGDHLLPALQPATATGNVLDLEMRTRRL